MPLPSSDPDEKTGSVVRGKVTMGSIVDLPRELREIALQEAEKIRTKGYLDAKEEDVDLYRNFHNYIRPLDSVLPNLKISLVDLNQSLFDGLRLEGVITGGPTKEGPWTSATRVFSSEEGYVIMLSEWDFVGDGGGVVLQKEMVNEKVNGRPAILTIHRAPSGQGYTDLVWYTDQKEYILSASGNQKESISRDRLLAMARSVKEPIGNNQTN